MKKELEFFQAPQELIKRNYIYKSVLPDYRTDFMRDRDRIMYATAFRRLAGKTQIYTVGSDDHKRNRLTHSLEVAQIARTISIALDLNADLTEAIALAHDFGHTPFGHAGEQMLHEIMIPNAKFVKTSPFYLQDYSSIKDRFERENKIEMDIIYHAFGFKHNLQSVRVTALLEDSYRGEYNENIGLNLTNFTLYGIQLHSSSKYEEEDEYPNYQNLFDEQMKFKGSKSFAWSFEAYVVKLADDVAQWHHDLEDAMRGGALPVEKICDAIRESLNTSLIEEDNQKLDEICATATMDRKSIAELSHIVVNTLINNIVKTSEANLKTILDELKKIKVDKPEIFFKEFDSLKLSIARDNIITISEEIDTKIFKGIIKGSVHHSRNVERMNEKGRYIIRKLFEAYYAHPQQLPDGPILHLLVEAKYKGYDNIDVAKKLGVGQARVDFDELMKNPTIFVQTLLMRRICDHIASMTDHYAIEEYNNLYG